MNLPIFRDLYRLNVALLKDIENIPKIHRHTLGDRIINTGLSSLHRLQQAYDAQSPTKRLYEMGNFSTELCPFCGQEVEIDAILDVHRCPNCQKVIVACSMCKDCKSDCYLEQEAKYLNGGE